VGVCVAVGVGLGVAVGVGVGVAVAVGVGVAVGVALGVGSGVSVIDSVNIAQPAVSTSATTNPVAQKVRLSDITASRRRTVLIHPTEFRISIAGRWVLSVPDRG